VLVVTVRSRLVGDSLLWRAAAQTYEKSNHSELSLIVKVERLGSVVRSQIDGIEFLSLMQLLPL
jgi:hypothetical protein